MDEIKSKIIEIIDIDKVTPNPKNSNIHTQEQIIHLEKLIKKTGFRNPLVISKRSGFLISGHARLEAAKNLKFKKIPVIWQDFESEAEEYSYLVADNEIARWAHLDHQELRLQLRSIPDLNIDFLGIKDFKIDNLEDLNFDAENEWKDMPEFYQPDKNAFRHVIVHFENESEVSKFFSLINQKYTDKTKTVWLPPQVRMDTESKRYE